LKYKSLLITGTDTGIGKTTVSCLLAAGLRQRGLHVGVLKPAETDCAPGDGEPGHDPQDVRRLRYFSGCELPTSTLCPYALREPLAPLVAARRQAVRIDLDRIVACHDDITAAHDITLVEGAGGLLVPLSEGANFVDLGKRLDCVVVVVVGNRLGAINHALLTIRHAEAAGLDVLGYIVNHVHADRDLAATTNVEVLRELAGAALGVVPFVTRLDLSTEARDELARTATTSIHLDRLLHPLS